MNNNRSFCFLQITLLLHIVFLSLGCARNKQKKLDSESLKEIEISKSIVSSFSREKFSIIDSLATKEMIDATISGNLVKHYWDDIVLQKGSFKAISGEEIHKINNHYLVILTLDFERAKYNFQFGFSNKNKLEGFYIKPEQ